MGWIRVIGCWNFDHRVSEWTPFFLEVIDCGFMDECAISSQPYWFSRWNCCVGASYYWFEKVKNEKFKLERNKLKKNSQWVVAIGGAISKTCQSLRRIGLTPSCSRGFISDHFLYSALVTSIKRKVCVCW